MNKLNIGCGPNWKEQYPDYEGLDKQPFGQKWVIDARKIANCGILPTYQSHYDEIMANHFLEHLTNKEIIEFLNNCWKLLKRGGILRLTVPHKDKDKSWQLTHNTFFTEETFRMMLHEDEKRELGLFNWELLELVTNHRLDIHCKLQKSFIKD